MYVITRYIIFIDLILIPPASQTSNTGQIKKRWYFTPPLTSWYIEGLERDGMVKDSSFPFPLLSTISCNIRHTYSVCVSALDTEFQEIAGNAQSPVSHQVIDPQKQGFHTAIAVALSAGRMPQVHQDELRQELQSKPTQTLLWAPEQIKQLMTHRRQQLERKRHKEDDDKVKETVRDTGTERNTPLQHEKKHKKAAYLRQTMKIKLIYCSIIQSYMI